MILKAKQSHYFEIVSSIEAKRIMLPEFQRDFVGSLTRRMISLIFNSRDLHWHSHLWQTLLWYDFT